MVRNETFEHLSTWLSEAMESDFKATRKPEYKTKTLIGLGRAGKHSEWIETMLAELIERYICLDKEKRILVGEDGATLYSFNGRYFEQIDVAAQKFVTELVKRTMRALRIGSGYIQKCPDGIAKSIVSTLTSSDEYLYKPDRRYIAFNNCVFDLKDRKPKTFSIDRNPYIVLDIDYHDKKECQQLGGQNCSMYDNPCNLWDKKLAEIIPCTETRDAFQQWCGSLLVDPNVYVREYVCYLLGTGANGKSVLANSISRVFGEQYFSHFTPRQLFKDSDRGANIAALRGKIANLVDDLNSSDISGGDYKRFASGQAFEARVPYEKRPVSVYAPPMLCCANEMPQQQDNSKGNERRQLILHTTTVSFLGDMQDPELTSKLTTPIGRMYIFHWIVEGYRKVCANKGRIQLGEKVISGMRRVMEMSNSLRRWYEYHGYSPVENPVRADDRWRSLKALYEEYVEFTREEGSDARKRIDLSNMLRQRGFGEGKCNLRRVSTGLEFCIERNLVEKP